jgi:iron complex outermembrane receptor protein
LGRAFVDHADYLGDYIRGSGPTRVVNVDYSNGGWAGAEVQWIFQPFAGQRLTVGSEFRDYFDEVQGNYTDSTIYLDDRRQNWLLGLYAQDDIQILPKVDLTLGGRFDDYSTFGGHGVPRGALVLGPFENARVKLMAGGAFRAPNSYELYYNDGNVTQKGNAGLVPETIQTFELEIEQSFLRDHRIILSIFRYTAADLIVQEVDPSDSLLIYNNVGAASANGVGIEYQFQCPDGIRGDASFTWQRAQDDSTGEWLDDSPQKLAKASLQTPLMEGLTLAGECQYNGESQSQNDGISPEFVVVNLKLSSQDLFAKGLRATLAAYNLFDRVYDHPTAASVLQTTIPQNGLVLWGNLSYKID